MGIRVLLAGWIVILFRKLSDINARLRRSIPATFGSRPVGFHVVDHVPTTAQPSLTYGTAVARQPNVQFAAVACVGLAITLPNGQDAISTVTHSFVDFPKRSFIRTAVDIAYSSISQIGKRHKRQ